MNSAKRFDMFRMVFSVLIALLISFVIIFFVSDEPVTAIVTLITGPFKSKRSMGNVIESMVPLIFTGTGVCIMFSANQINLATEGGFHLGGLVAAAVALKLGLPAGLSPIVAISLAAVAGAVFCAIPALMKIKTNSPELVSSLMINYISLWLCTFLLMHFLQDPSVGSASYKLPPESELPTLIKGTNIHLGLLIAFVVAVFGYVFLYKTRTGYELRLTGENENFARYSGINIVKVILISQMVGGVIAGIGGSVELLSPWIWRGCNYYLYTGEEKPTLYTTCRAFFGLSKNRSFDYGPLYRCYTGDCADYAGHYYSFSSGRAVLKRYEAPHDSKRGKSIS